MNRKPRKKLRKRRVFWLVQLILELALFVSLFCSKLVPAPFLMMTGIVLVLLLFITFILFFSRRKSRHSPKRKIAYVLSVLTMLCCVVNLGILGYASHVVSSLTVEAPNTMSVGVYVRVDDPAQVLEDASSYTFATFPSVYLSEEVEQLNEQLGKIKTQYCSDSAGAVDALRNGSADALIADTGTITLLQDMDEYATVEDELRMLSEHSVKVLANDAQDSSTDGQDGQSTGTGEETVIMPGGSPSAYYGQIFSSLNTAINAGSLNREKTDGAFLLYISGVDSRKPEIIPNSSSDVNILAAVNPKTRQILLVNTPRDYYVYSPVSGNQRDKLTYCDVYTVQCSIDTLSALYQIPVDYYIQLNFSGFETLIDIVGGVDINSDMAFKAGGTWIQEGKNHLNGKQALAYARERKHLNGGGDRERGRHQMNVVSAMIYQLSASTVIANYSSIMDALDGLFYTNFSKDQIAELVQAQLTGRHAWSVLSYATDGENDMGSCYSMPGREVFYIEPDMKTVVHASDLMYRVLCGERLSAASVNSVGG